MGRNLNKEVEQAVSWYTNEEDELLSFAKLFVLVAISFPILITLPIWIVPYLVWKNK